MPTTLATADSHLSIAERRPRRRPVLPARFRDILPQPPSTLPSGLDLNALPQGSPLTGQCDPEELQSVADSGSPLQLEARPVFKAPKNIFSLFRQYHSTEPPTHDPEEYIDLQDLSNIPVHRPDGSPPPEETLEAAYDPYPNLSSFLLGDWYWNYGLQKSQSTFKQLISIVGAPDFKPSDVRHTPWDRINRQLADNKPEEEEAGWEWLDEDAGWKKDHVSISVPFHRRTKHPGVQTYVVEDFYHRSLVSVIREKLTNLNYDRHFHYEPYELYWQVHDTDTPIRVHGEAYTSAAFSEAYHELQASPKEPGCDLQRVVVALMFSSDSTHLTSFGDTKIWPLYLFCGNESKYRRSKPSLHLCDHIAYFHKVRARTPMTSSGLTFHYFISSQMPSRSLLLAMLAVKALVTHS
jgi:hypothetical protein